MKRFNSYSTISKLGESAYNALVMINQVHGDEKRILHYSYNLSGDDEDTSYGELTKSKPQFGSPRITRRAFSKEENQPTGSFKNGLQRSNSIAHLPRNNDGNLTGSEFMLYSGVQHGGVCKQSSTEANETGSHGPAPKTNGSRETHTRKYGLAETTNVSLMSHKLRKKGVCDSTDNSHYQRQFLRVLNKRF